MYLLILKSFMLFNMCSSVLCCSEITAEGRRITKLDQILLNGNNIAIVSVGLEVKFSPIVHACG